MKRITLLMIIFTALAASSCKKTYTCQCGTTPIGQPNTVLTRSFTVQANNATDANMICQSEEQSYENCASAN